MGHSAKGVPMAQVLAVSPRANSATGEPAFAALGLLSHTVREMVPDTLVASEADRADIIVLDGRADLASARQMCRLLDAAGSATPILLVLGEGGFAAVSSDWGVRDVVLGSAGPGEFDARIRLAVARDATGGVVSAGGLVIDETAYHASLNGRQLDLTYTEFELLKYLAQAPGRVFTRETLLSDVWGYDYYGGTRTVDVHVRRLRAKLGVENEYLIGTVRNVGYRFSPDAAPRQDLTA